MLVDRTPGSRWRLAVDDDGLVVRAGSKKHPELRVRPPDLPHRARVPGEGVELVVLAVAHNLEDVDLAVARCGGELLAIVIQLRVVDVAAVVCVYRLQGICGHLSELCCSSSVWDSRVVGAGCSSARPNGKKSETFFSFASFPRR